MIHRFFVSVIAVLAICLVVVPSASAHPMIPRLEISVERQIPGGVVDVRGVAFGIEETVNLALIASGVEISLGEMITDAEGEFIHIAVLPTDLTEGAYYFRATTSHHWVLSPPLTVWGIAIEEGGGQGPREDEDALLAPMPTAAPPAATAPVASTPIKVKPSRTRDPFVIALASLAVIGVAVLIGFKRKRLR